MSIVWSECETGFGMVVRENPLNKDTSLEKEGYNLFL
jgi:hypothetical protein